MALAEGKSQRAPRPRRSSRGRRPRRRSPDKVALKPGGASGAVAGGPSRPTAVAPTDKNIAKASATARRRSCPGGVGSSPSTSITTRLIPDIHDPLLAEKVERGGPAFAVAEARVLHAPEGDLRFTAQRRYVHVEHAGLRFLRVSKRGAEIVRVDRG